MENYAHGEQQRLDALRHLAILNTPREKRFDDIAQLAAQLLSAPIALISLVEDTHQWFKACIGLPVQGTSREVSFCAHAIARDDLESVFVVNDATKDPVFRGNPFVMGEPHIRFYAGAPLVTKDGYAIGTLCVIDTAPRQPTDAQLDALKVLARSAVAQMELRRTAESLRESEGQMRLLIDTAREAIITADGDKRVISWNAEATRLFGIDADAAYGQRVADLVLPAEERTTKGPELEALCGSEEILGQPWRTEVCLARGDGSRFMAEVAVSGWVSGGQRRLTVFIQDISARKAREEEQREAETRDVVIFAMARLADSRDPETGAHIERVQTYCRALAEQLASCGPYQKQCDPEFVRLMYSTSPLHDIGKVGIPDDILLKPGRLSDREFEIMKSHTTIGAETLEAAIEKFPNTRFLRMARNIAASHHERFDGSGYPAGLIGQDIPLCGRIVALADVYDALTSRRVYKAAFTHDVAKGIIVKESGKHFDPVIVDAFLAIEQQFASISRKFVESDTLAA